MTASTGRTLGPPADAALDNPAWGSLTGVHARFAASTRRAARYEANVAPFSAVDDMHDPAAWIEMGELVGPGGEVMTAGPAGLPVPPTWEPVFSLAGVQMVDTAVHAERDAEVVELGASDVPEMLHLVERAQPGPFRERTVELGRYVGIRRGGRLVAMAGERLQPAGWTEISAVCTDAEHRGHGMATRLIRDVAAGIRARGDIPFLHTSAANANAIRLYEHLGFAVRTGISFQRWEIPASA